MKRKSSGEAISAPLSAFDPGNPETLKPCPRSLMSTTPDLTYIHLREVSATPEPTLMHLREV